MGLESSLRKRPSGMTVGRWLTVAAISAPVLTLLRFSSYEPLLQLGLGILILTLVAARMLVLVLYAKRCTVCGKGPVGLVVAVPFGEKYYRCGNCGQRSKRLYMGRLWDASGPEDDRRFRRPEGIQTWGKSPSIEPTPDRPETRTVGGLLVSKVDRETEDPHEPVVVGTIPVPEQESPTPSENSGVEPPVAERFAKTLEKIRWSRRFRD